MTLQDPNTAQDQDGGYGTWTMIYDEGFEVAFQDYTFFAFSGFSFVNGPHGKTNVSHCGETQVGWYHDTNRHNWGCYYGKKVTGSDGQQQSNQDADAPRPRKRSSWLS